VSDWSSTEERAMETRESAQSQDLKERNVQLEEHIEEAERAIDRRRSATGETPAGDMHALEDSAGGDDPSGAVNRPQRPGDK
jgi:hypothetical protein